MKIKLNKENAEKLDLTEGQEVIIESASQWSEAERLLRKTSITDKELYDVLTAAGHNVYSMINDRALLANYLAGVLEGSISG